MTTKQRKRASISTPTATSAKHSGLVYPEGVDPTIWVEALAARRELDDISRQGLKNFVDQGRIRVLNFKANQRLYYWPDVVAFSASWKRPAHGKQPI